MAGRVRQPHGVLSSQAAAPRSQARAEQGPPCESHPPLSLGVGGMRVGVTGRRVSRQGHPGLRASRAAGM